MSNIAVIASLKKLNRPNSSHDLALMVGTLFAWGGIASYVFMKLHMQYYRNNWDDVKCDAHIIPFAGEIMQPVHNGDPNVFTQENFAACAQANAERITKDVLGPIENDLGNTLNTMNRANEGVNNATETFRKLGQEMVQLLSNIWNALKSVVDENTRILHITRDIVGKVVGAVSTAFMMTMTVYKTIKSVLGAIVGDFVVTCYALIAAITIALASFFGAAAAIPIGVTLVATTTLTIAISSMLMSMFGISTPAVPSWCFSPDTIVSVNGGNSVRMEDVRLGDTIDGSDAVVMATMRIKNTDESGNPCERMFVMDTTTTVSGSHLIFDEEKDVYVRVSSYAERHEDVVETAAVIPELRCLITSNHTIPIGKRMFHDWEDNQE